VDDKNAADSFQALFYPGTQTLINHFGERDPHKLASLERAHAMAAGLDARMFNPIRGDFDLKHMQAIHERLFGGVYPWAGQVRDFPLFKRRADGLTTEFARPNELPLIDAELRLIMQRTSSFRNLQPGHFVEEIARVYQLANQMHPFREGNGRTHQLYLEYLADRAGFDLDFSRVEKAAWNYAASTAARIRLGEGEYVPGRTDELHRVFAHITQPPEQRAGSYHIGRERLAPGPAGEKLTLKDLNPTLSGYVPRRRL
jgi:fido (protein-threonine AMPylation protein)